MDRAWAHALSSSIDLLQTSVWYCREALQRSLLSLVSMLVVIVVITVVSSAGPSQRSSIVIKSAGRHVYQ